MVPTVTLTLPDGTRRALIPGDIIGRMVTADLCLDDPRVSEAHALVTLRGGALQLLALRGRFSVGDGPVTEATLRAGQRLILAPGLSLDVEAVTLPDHALALQGGGLPRQLIQGVCSLYAHPPRLVTRFLGDADAWLWSTADGLKVRVGDDAARDLVAGPLRIGDTTFDVVPVRAEGQQPTIAGAVGGRLTVVAHWDTAHVQRDGADPVAFNGKQAQLISELVTIGAPVSWRDVATTLWPDSDDDNDLRRRWDITLYRIRARLKASGVRPDLLRPDGTGNIELFLHQGDVAHDHT